MKQRPDGWRGIKGYRVIEEIDEYKHNFGGQDCEVPVCKLWGKKCIKYFVLI
jgi:hypothetical protein